MVESSAEPPGAVPWRCVFIGPDGRRQTRHRWSRPTASAVEIADEVMALFARVIMEDGGDRDQVEKLLAGCVVQVTRPAFEGWPEEYGEAHGITWLPETRNGSEPNRIEPAPTLVNR